MAEGQPMNIQPAEPHGNLPSEPGFLYHATNSESLYDIATSGAINVHEPWYGTDQDAWPDGSEEKRAYFSPKAGAVWALAPEDGDPAILRVPTTATKFYREPTGDWYSRTPVPVKDAEFLATDGQWYSLGMLLQ